jgi:hypothetical protein
MRRRDLALGWVALPAWLAVSSGSFAAPSEADAASGVRTALERGALSAVANLGRADGFLGNPKVRIALPRALDSAARLLKVTGQQHLVDDLETAMNRAAEAAVPQAKTLLVQTAKSISVQDAWQIVRGSQTSVTDYFAAHTRGKLTEQLLPIVSRETEKVALADKYNAVAGKASALGLLKGEDANIQRYVTARALDGLYLMIGEEERRIRADPVGTGSAILRQVFGH